MKKYIVPLSAVSVVAVFFLGYYAGNSKTPSHQEEAAVFSVKKAEVIENKQQDLSKIKEERTRNAEIQPAKKDAPLVLSAAEAEEAASLEPKRQTKKQLIISLRKQGVPERDVERVANALTMLTGAAPAPEAAELPAQQREETIASVQAAGVPEKDIERVANALGTVVLSEVPEKSYEETKVEAAVNARAAGVPNEDVERVANALAGPEPQDAIILEQTDEEYAEKKAEVIAKVRAAGVPNEDVERVANALTEAGASPKQENSSDK